MSDHQIIFISLAVLLWFAGYLHNGRFVRPKWKIPGKFIFYTGVSFALVYWFTHWAPFFIILHPLIGLIFHISVCRKNNINWVNCQPREKYLELQEKWAKGRFRTASSKPPE